MTIIVNLMGGPGCGKSTLAAGVYSELKLRNINVELVREYVKAWAYRGDKINRYDELYIFAKQLREESNLYGKVDIIVTDRPLYMSAVYDRFYSGSGLLEETCKRVRELQLTEDLLHIDLMVQRTKPYHQVGRFESEVGAKDIDSLTMEMFPGLLKVSSVKDIINIIQHASHLLDPLETFEQNVDEIQKSRVINVSIPYVQSKARASSGGPCPCGDQEKKFHPVGWCVAGQERKN